MIRINGSRNRVAAWIAVIAVTALAAFALERRGTAADHRDSSALVNDQPADIADVFVFESPESSGNLVLAMTVPGLIAPTETRFFAEDILYQFRIDTTGDAVEDQVIQATVTGTGPTQTIEFRGPGTPVTLGGTSQLLPGDPAVSVQFSSGATPTIAEGGGLKVFAGLRDDPFFFDLARFNDIVMGNETAFRDPGVDAFAGANALAIVVELPAATFGATNLGVWGTTSREN